MKLPGYKESCLQLLLGAFLIFGVSLPSANARPLINLNKALEIGYPKCKISQKNFFLTDKQVETLKEKTEASVPSALISRHKIKCKKKKPTYVYLDTTIVRTQYQTMAIFLKKSGEVERVELISFGEPPDFILNKDWFALFNKKKELDKVALQTGIPMVMGATLSSRSASLGVQRALVLHKLLQK